MTGTGTVLPQHAFGGGPDGDRPFRRGQGPPLKIIAAAGSNRLLAEYMACLLSPRVFVSPLQAYAQVEASGQQGSPEAPEPYGMPWRVSVAMAATNLRPAQTYAIRATEGLTVRSLAWGSARAAAARSTYSPTVRKAQQ